VIIQERFSSNAVSSFTTPQLYYIRAKEDDGDQAVSVSSQKVEFAEALFLQNYTKLAALVADRTDFFEHEPASLDGALARVRCLKRVVEEEGC
jgi:hypothetical protein